MEKDHSQSKIIKSKFTCIVSLRIICKQKVEFVLSTFNYKMKTKTLKLLALNLNFSQELEELMTSKKLNLLAVRHLEY